MQTSPATTPRQRLLVVDDDLDTVRLLIGILDGVARIFFATSGEDALRQIRQHAPDLVLLDAEMPGMDGFSTCAAIKEDPDTADLPVIFVTARTDTDSETRALAIGAVDFIHKPVNPPVVTARVKTHLALKHKSDELRRLTAVDALTGMTNRRAFDDTLRMEWRRAMRSRAPLSLLLLDVDFFKAYNDTYGHLAGDECLRKVADVLTAAARRAGDVAARYGGEEFAVILPHTSAIDAHRIAERLCAAVRDLAIPHGGSLVAPRVTISVGVASMLLPCEAVDNALLLCHRCSRFERCRAAPDDLVALADRALYTAKRNGRNRVSDLVHAIEPPEEGSAGE